MERSIRENYFLRIRGKETGEKPAVMGYIRGAVLLCFVIGIIVANIMEKKHLSEFGIWNTYFIEKFKYTHIDSMEIFLYIFEIRMPAILLLVLLIVTEWGTIAAALFLAWQGFAAGFLMAVAIIGYGLKGILLIATAAFPHYFIYIAIYIVYIYLADFLKGKIQFRSYRNGKNIKTIFLCLIVGLLILSVYITGVFLESYVNPYLLRQILKIF